MIKFRGKRVDNGEWVYGAYVHNNGNPYIISHEIAEVCEDEYIHPAWWYRVAPESVGQFIWLEDEKGVEVYEDDVVSYGCGEYCQGYSGTIIVDITEASLFSEFESLKILGNIHDNPVLWRVVK